MAVTVVLGTEKGGFLCRSEDRRSWTVEGPLFKGWKVTAAGRTPTGRYLVGTASRVYGPALHASDDLSGWRQIENGPAYPEGGDRKLAQIWTLATEGPRLYAGVESAGVFHSDDDGASWHPLPGLNDHPSRRNWFPGAGGLCAHTVLVDHANPDRLWCGISAVGVWRSDDGGETWHTKNEGIRKVIEDKEFTGIGYCVHRLVQDPDDADTLYRQDHTGMYRSQDAGDTWQKKMDGLPSWFGFPIAIDREGKRLFCFPMESDEYRLPVDGRFRVYRSSDRGESWEECASGLPEAPSWAGVLRGAMAVDDLDPCGVYVGSTAGEVFASPDAGDTWARIPCTLPRILSVSAFAEA